MFSRPIRWVNFSLPALELRDDPSEPGFKFSRMQLCFCGVVFRVFHAGVGFKVPAQMSMWTDFAGKTSPSGNFLEGSVLGASCVDPEG